MGKDLWHLDEAMIREYQVELVDKRLTARMAKLGKVLSLDPGASMPVLLPNESDLEAFYKFLNNQRVNWRWTWYGHKFAASERAAALPVVLSVSDTTGIEIPLYWDDKVRKHFTKVATRTQGFNLHVTLAVEPGPRGRPLGVVGLQPYVHRSDVEVGSETEAYWKAEGGYYDNEMQRWFDGFLEAEQFLGRDGRKVIHVTDREGDAYSLLAGLHRENMCFVIRCVDQNRLRTVHHESLAASQVLGEITVDLGDRFPLRPTKQVKTHPTRKARTTTLEIRATAIVLQKPKRTDNPWGPGGWDSLAPSIEVHLVEVVEKNPPAGEPPVHWHLLTTEPIGTPEQVMEIVEYYRNRWLIEEWNKALKTGCKIEQRQMDSMPAFLRMLGLLVPAAWKLLQLRLLAEDCPGAPWQVALTPLEFHVLRAKLPKMLKSANATVRDVHLAIAKLGGHLKRNGPPGWIVLHRGFSKLQTFVEGVELARGFVEEKPS